MNRAFWLSGFLAFVPFLALAQFPQPGGMSSAAGGGITPATFASPPAAPTLNQAFLFSDASATGVCTGGGSAYAVCVWNGASFAAIGGTSTGLGDPGANSVVYRNGSGTSIPATATQMSGPNFCLDAGSTDTYACNLSPVIASYVTGTIYWFKANTVNTGAASINLNAKGALTIKKMQAAITTDLADNDIRVGQWVGVLYDGTNAQMVSQLGNAVTDASLPVTDVTTNNVSSGAHGFTPKSPADATKFLNGATTPAYAAVKDSDLATTDVTSNNVSSTVHGFTPKAPADATKFLNGAATPAYAAVKDSDLAVIDVTTNNVSTSNHGFAPKLPNDSTKYLDGTGAYSNPAANALADFSTGTSKTFSLNGGYFECTGTCTVTMPVPVAGMQYCVRNSNNVATVITLAAIGSSARYENTASTAYGTAGTGTFVSSGAVGDKVCLVGKDSTHFDILAFNGTWTAN